MSIRVGCGSWADDEYVGVLYPPKLPPAKRLSEYAKHFDTVEVNSSYYATPKRAVVENWIKQTPPGFLFDIKLHRNVLSSLVKAQTGAAKPKKGTEDSPDGGDKPFSDLLTYLLGQIEPLIKAKKLGVFVLLLSRFNPEKKSVRDLDLLVEKIKPHPLAVEFRHRGWVDAKRRADTLAYFRERGLTWTCVDMPSLDDDSIMPPMDEVTQPKLAYLRLHGRNPLYLEGNSAEERHTYLYSEQELEEIVKRIERLSRLAANVRVVANNHAQDFAPRTALGIRSLLQRGTGG